MAWSYFVILAVLMGSASLMPSSSPGSRDHVLSRQKRTLGPVSFGRVNVIGARCEKLRTLLESLRILCPFVLF